MQEPVNSKFLKKTKQDTMDLPPLTLSSIQETKQLFVRLGTGPVIILDLNFATTTIGQLAIQVGRIAEDRLHWKNTPNINFYFNCRMLNNEDRTLAELGIQPSYQLQALLKLKGD